LVLLPGVLLTIGVCWVLASVGVYLRDTGQIVGILTMALLFLSPVFYPVTAIPEAYRKFLYLNPLTLVIESGRGALIWGTIPGWRGMVAYSGLALLVAWTGFCWFQKTRRGFADVV
jgi:lipopolysaccharide transport system permease protein